MRDFFWFAAITVTLFSVSEYYATSGSATTVRAQAQPVVQAEAAEFVAAHSASPFAY